MAAMKKNRPWYQYAKEVLRDREISYQQAAELLGVEKPRFGHWMTGRNDPPVAMIIRLAEVLGMSVSELCGEDAYFLVEESERKLIDQFRGMGEEEKKMFLRILQGAQDDSSQKK